MVLLTTAKSHEKAPPATVVRPSGISIHSESVWLYVCLRKDRILQVRARVSSSSHDTTGVTGKKEYSQHGPGL